MFSQLRKSLLLKLRFLPDLSDSWKDPGIPQKQRSIADVELADMYAGRTPDLFVVLAQTLNIIKADRPLSLLEVGCASGYYLEVIKHLVKLDVNYQGADFSEAMLALARQKYPGTPFYEVDARALSFGDKSFDIVLAGAILQHIREYNIALEELARVSRSWLVLHRTLVCTRGHTFSRVGRAYDVDVYEVYIEERELLHAMSNFGFRLLSKMECGPLSAYTGIGMYTYLLHRTF